MLVYGRTVLSTKAPKPGGGKDKKIILENRSVLMGQLKARAVAHYRKGSDSYKTEKDRLKRQNVRVQEAPNHTSLHGSIEKTLQPWMSVTEAFFIYIQLRPNTSSKQISKLVQVFMDGWQVIVMYQLLHSVKRNYYFMRTMREPEMWVRLAEIEYKGSRVYSRVGRSVKDVQIKISSLKSRQFYQFCSCISY